MIGVVHAQTAADQVIPVTWERRGEAQHFEQFVPYDRINPSG